MTTQIHNQVHGQITIKDEHPNFHGDEILYIFVQDSLRHEIDCVELGSRIIQLCKEQPMPIDFRCLYKPDRTHMKFEEMKTVLGGVTLAATIERNGQILYINNTNIPLGENIDIQLVKSDRNGLRQFSV